MKKSRFYRIFISYLIVIFLLSIFLLIFLTPFFRSQYLKNQIENLSHLSFTLQTMIKPIIEQENWQGLDKLIKDINKQTGIRISVMNTEGKVIAESSKNFREMESHSNRPEVREALQGEESHIVRYSTTTKEEMLYVSSPILIEENIRGVLRLSTFLDEMNYVLNQLRNIILLGAIMMILISLLLSYYISKRLTIPINILVQGFKRVGEGDLETRIVSHREEPEIKELSDRFNEMTEKIKQLVHELSLQTEELESIISTIQSGIALLDEKGKIILSNSHFNKIFSSYQLKDKYFWEVIRDGQISKLVSVLIEKKKDFSAEIELSEKYYICNGIYVEKKDKSILVFHDINQSRKLAQVKKDLITNISHELRTPLTSIKGYLETMEDASDREREQYIQIISRNTERMINMVNDLLFLSELEDKSGKLEIEKVNLKEMAENLTKIFEPAIRINNLRFNLNFQNGLPEIEADPYKIEQMLINLIDNSIKYTEKGEITFSIVMVLNDKVKIEITDTGIGIKREDIDRIFERFYVVNKARSRKQGGTGLGLSIVKHIVMLHKGEIDIDSQLGLRTKIMVILPVKQS